VSRRFEPDRERGALYAAVRDRMRTGTPVAV
jgi:hypothetical protein